MEACQEHWAAGAFPFHRIRPHHTHHMFHLYHTRHFRHWPCLAEQNFDASHYARLVLEVLLLLMPSHVLHLQAVLEEAVVV